MKPFNPTSSALAHIANQLMAVNYDDSLRPNEEGWLHGPLDAQKDVESEALRKVLVNSRNALFASQGRVDDQALNNLRRLRIKVETFDHPNGGAVKQVVITVNSGKIAIN